MEDREGNRGGPTKEERVVKQGRGEASEFIGARVIFQEGEGRGRKAGNTKGSRNQGREGKGRRENSKLPPHLFCPCS